VERRERKGEGEGEDASWLLGGMDVPDYSDSLSLSIGQYMCRYLPREVLRSREFVCWLVCSLRSL